MKSRLNAFITKFLLYAPVAGILLPNFSGVSTSDAVIAGLLAAAASFLTADMLVYPRYGNFPAVAADVVISAIILMEMSYLSGTPLTLPGLAILAAVIGAGEWFYHPYLRRTVFSKSSGRRR